VKRLLHLSLPGRADGNWLNGLNLLNIEYRILNNERETSKFDILCSIFYIQFSIAERKRLWQTVAGESLLKPRAVF